MIANVVKKVVSVVKGGVEEFEDIVSGFNKTIARLDKYIDRKLQEASGFEAVAEKASVAAVEADKAADRASVVRAKIRGLVS